MAPADRKFASTILRSERAQELLLKAVHDALWDWDLGKNEIQWNEGLSKIFGHSNPERTTTAEWGRDQIHPEDRERVQATVRSVLKSKAENWLCEYRFRRADGTYANVLDRAYVYWSSDGRMIRVLGAMVDLTPQKQAEGKVLERDHQLQQAQQVAKMGSWEMDLFSGVFHLSDELCRIFELPPGTPVDTETRMRLIHREDLPRVMDAAKTAISTGTKYQIDYRIRVPSGEKHIHARGEPVVSPNGEILKYVGIGQDITDRMQAEKAARENEEQIRQLQKMDAIGRLAGGIAHDYNNMLAAIRLNCELVMEEVTAEGRENVEQILGIVERGVSLTRQLLLFSRKQPQSKRKLNLNQSIQHFEKMLLRLVGDSIEIKTECDPKLSPIEADAGLMDQVLLNLVANAKDAMPDGGTISIRTNNFLMTGEWTPDPTQNLAPGPYVQLSIQDTGTGMTPEVQSKIFEPFFTTKPLGQGTGLGLSTLYGILKDHGGGINVYSEVGRGSVFKLFFPALKDSEPTSSSETLPSLSGKQTCVLLVEDEEDLRKSAEGILTKLNFRVLSAVDGHEAIRIFNEQPDKIQIMVTDLTMPGMSGMALAKTIREQSRNLPVVFISGYTENIDALNQELGNGNSHFLTKPFSGRMLVQTIQELLKE